MAPLIPMDCPETRAVPPGFLMVIFAETSGESQPPVAVHCSRTEEPATTSVGVDAMVIDRAAAWLLPADRMIITSPMTAILMRFLLSS
jgi:hypothetical protein